MRTPNLYVQYIHCQAPFLRILVCINWCYEPEYGRLAEVHKVKSATVASCSNDLLLL